MDKAMEEGQAEDHIEDLLAKVVPRKGGKCRMKAQLKTENGIINLEGEVDDYLAETHYIGERKTGKTKWTQGKAQNHGQLAFYALMIYLNHKIVTKKIELIWVETQDSEEGEIELTGNVLYFQVNLELVDILKMAARIQKAAKEISEVYKRESKIF